MCALTDNMDRIHADRAIVSRFVYDVEVEMEGTRQVAEYRESQAKIEAGRVLELSKQLIELRGVVHARSIQLAALMTSAEALCDCLDTLDAGDLCLELRAVRLALSGQRVEAMARFLDNSVRESEVRTTLRQALKQLDVKPEATSSTEKWVFRAEQHTTAAIDRMAEKFLK